MTTRKPLPVGLERPERNQAQLVRLATASGTFEQITLDASLYMDVGFEFWPLVQWDGKHMTVSSGPERKPASIYRLRISGSTATVAGTADLSTQKDVYTGQFVLQGRTVVGLGNYQSRRDRFSFGGIREAAARIGR